LVETLGAEAVFEFEVARPKLTVQFKCKRDVEKIFGVNITAKDMTSNQSAEGDRFRGQKSDVFNDKGKQFYEVIVVQFAGFQQFFFVCKEFYKRKTGGHKVELVCDDDFSGRRVGFDLRRKDFIYINNDD